MGKLKEAIEKMNVQERVAYAAGRAYDEHLITGTSGNFSEYLRELDIMAITPTSLDYLDMDQSDIVLMKLDGTIVEGELKPSSEWRMHAAIYEQRPDIKAIVHTHSPYATSFAVLNESIPIVMVETLACLGGDIPLSRFAMPGTRELGESALEALAERNACLLANHGVIAVGDSLQQAYTMAQCVEDSAMVYYHARSIGTPVEISEETIEEFLKNR